MTTVDSVPAGSVAADIDRNTGLSKVCGTRLEQSTEKVKRGSMDLPALTIISFILPKPTLLLNQTLRMHWSARNRANRSLAWEVVAAVGRKRPAKPLQRARVTIIRCSVNTPDTDNLVGGTKSLVDSLLKPSRTHPWGVGIIEDDSPKHIQLIVLSERVARRADQRTIVKIEELPEETI